MAQNKSSNLPPFSDNFIATPWGQLCRDSLDVVHQTRQALMTEFKAAHEEFQDLHFQIATQAIQRSTEVLTQIVHSTGEISRLVLEEIEQTSHKAGDLLQHLFEDWFENGVFQTKEPPKVRRTATVIPITIQDN